MISPAREPAVLAVEVRTMEPDGRTLERLDADDTRHVHVVPKAGAWGVESEHVAWKHGGEPCLICGVTYPEYVDGIVPGSRGDA